MVKYASSSGTGLVLFVSTLLCIGCSTDPFNPDPGGEGFSLWGTLPWDKITVATHGQLYVTSRRSGLRDPGYLSGAGLFSSTEHTSPGIDGGNALLADLTVSFDPSENGYLSVSQPTFGAVSSWGLAGNSANGIPSFSGTMYLPEEIQFSSPVPTPQATLSKGDDITVTWNPDPMYDGDVVVGFRYDKSLSRFVDPSLPDAEINWFETTEDDGNYVISSGELSALPVGGIMLLVIARGNADVMGTSSHKFYVYGYTVAEGIFRITE